MTGSWRAFGRLLLLQASWTYERMQGVGMGFAALPLLQPLRAEPERYRAAVARAADYFNANPYLAGIALGAEARAELDGAPGEQVQRLRTALCGPLGSLGDQLFWVGLVPGLAGLTLSGATRGGGAWVVAAFVALHNAVRLGVGYWALRAGAAAGLGVSGALARSKLPLAAAYAGRFAGFGVGIALPAVGAWFLRAGGAAGWLAAGAAALAGAGVARVQVRLPSPVTLTLVALALALLWRWSGA